jgi:hypothetical protein
VTCFFVSHTHIEEGIEYGAYESGCYYDGEEGRKLLKEGYLKIPKT